VTQVSPTLAVKLDGDSSALPFVPDSLVYAGAVTVGSRVRCELTAGRQVIVHGTSAALSGRGSGALRDATFGTPSTGAQQSALANEMVSWFNTDNGWWESYFAPTGTTGLTAKGLITGTPAGWYPIAGRMPKETLLISSVGIGGISANQYCFHGGYLQSVATNALDGITFDSTTGKLTCPTVGEYRVGWAAAQSLNGATASLVIVASLNSTTSPTAAAAGSVYGVNGAFGGVEVAANAASYTWNLAPAGLRIPTTSATDYFQFWFGGGSGSTSTVSFNSAYPSMNKAQYLTVEYVGPALIVN
jgi:hypothetical protein